MGQFNFKEAFILSKISILFLGVHLIVPRSLYILKNTRNPAWDLLTQLTPLTQTSFRWALLFTHTSKSTKHIYKSNWILRTNYDWEACLTEIQQKCQMVIPTLLWYAPWLTIFMHHCNYTLLKSTSKNIVLLTVKKQMTLTLKRFHSNLFWFGLLFSYAMAKVCECELPCTIYCIYGVRQSRRLVFSVYCPQSTQHTWDVCVRKESQAYYFQCSSKFINACNWNGWVQNSSARTVKLMWVSESTIDCFPQGSTRLFHLTLWYNNIYRCISGISNRKSSR